MSMGPDVNMAYGFTVPVEEAYSLLDLEIPDDIKDDPRELGMKLWMKPPVGGIAACVHFGENTDFKSALVYESRTRINLAETYDQDFTAMLRVEGSETGDDPFGDFARKNGHSPSWHYWIDWDARM